MINISKEIFRSSIFNNLKNLKYQRTSAGNKLQRLMKYICAFDAKNLTLYTQKIHDVHLLLFIKSNKKKSPRVFGRSELVRNTLKYFRES